MTDIHDDAVRTTSDWMAEIRRLEHARDDRYLADPYAAVLVDGGTSADTATMIEAGGPIEVVITRGRFGDAMLRAAVVDGVRQVVVLAAGSDTRAYRLGLPAGVTLYELDLPGQLAAKHAALAAAGARATCRLVTVDADLREDWPAALLTAGFALDRPTAWVIEGLFYYVDQATADGLLKEVTGLSAAGSRAVLDYPHLAYLDEPANRRFLDFMAGRGSPFVGATGDPAGWLAGQGWEAQAYLPYDLSKGGCPLLPALPPRLYHGAHPIWHVLATR